MARTDRGGIGMAPQQMQIWEKSKRELLVQGSGIDTLDMAHFFPGHQRRLFGRSA